MRDETYCPARDWEEPSDVWLPNGQARLQARLSEGKMRLDGHSPPLKQPFRDVATIFVALTPLP